MFLILPVQTIGSFEILDWLRPKQRTTSACPKPEKKPIAAPIVGGMITSTIHVLIVTPVIFYVMKVRALRLGTPKLSAMKSH